MAIKTFKCTVCGEEVTKPQSYAYKEGRACRSHAEVQQHFESQEKPKVNNTYKSKLADPIAFDSFDKAMLRMRIKNPNEHCWCCEQEGVYESIIYERFLVNMSKVEMKSSEPIAMLEVSETGIRLNKLILDETRKELGDKVPLRRMPIDSNFPDRKLKDILNQDKLQLAHLTNNIVLCNTCATSNSFEWEYVRDNNIGVKELMALGSFAKHLFDTVAAAEIATEEIANVMSK